MPTTEKISISLTADLASLVKNAVDNGYYASTSEVIREALRDWKHKQQTQKLSLLWQEGINSGSAGVLDIEAIKQEARKKHQDK